MRRRVIRNVPRATCSKRDARAAIWSASSVSSAARPSINARCGASSASRLASLSRAPCARRRRRSDSRAAGRSRCTAAVGTRAERAAQAEIACSRLLSVTATSLQPASTSSSFVTSWPAWLHQAIENVEVPVGDRDRLPVPRQAARKRIELEAVEGEARKRRHAAHCSEPTPRKRLCKPRCDRCRTIRDVALYAFDGTWNREHSEDEVARNTNVKRFFDLYEGTRNVYRRRRRDAAGPPRPNRRRRLRRWRIQPAERDVPEPVRRITSPATRESISSDSAAAPRSRSISRT